MWWRHHILLELWCWRVQIHRWEGKNNSEIVPSHSSVLDWHEVLVQWCVLMLAIIEHGLIFGFVDQSIIRRLYMLILYDSLSWADKVCGSLVVQINRTTHLADLVMFGRTNSSGSRILNHTHSGVHPTRSGNAIVGWPGSGEFLQQRWQKCWNKIPRLFFDNVQFCEIEFLIFVRYISR